jgi:hypothetical protein
MSISSSNNQVEYLDGIDPTLIQYDMDYVLQPKPYTDIYFQKAVKIQLPKLSDWISDITITVTIKDWGYDIERDGSEDFVLPESGTIKDEPFVKAWIIKKRTRTCPTSLTHIPTNTCLSEDIWYNIHGIPLSPLVCFYQCEKEIKPPGRPNYEGMSIHETFSAVTALGFTLNDIKPKIIAALPQFTTADMFADYIFGGTLGNVSTGTFVVMNATNLGKRDMISDQYTGFGTEGSFISEAFTDVDGIGWEQQQYYKCGQDLIRTNILSTRLIKEKKADGTFVTIKLEKKFKKI